MRTAPWTGPDPTCAGKVQRAPNCIAAREGDCDMAAALSCCAKAPAPADREDHVLHCSWPAPRTQIAWSRNGAMGAGGGVPDPRGVGGSVGLSLGTGGELPGRQPTGVAVVDDALLAMPDLGVAAGTPAPSGGISSGGRTRTLATLEQLAGASTVTSPLCVEPSESALCTDSASGVTPCGIADPMDFLCSPARSSCNRGDNAATDAQAFKLTQGL
mmetsp:Transcript_102325/g.285066  ORF Transcript_102325/g.285066 Transcript_102325/m.285066 type:complete len:215 (+) Transcript_102325:332-976(+)